jgi:hypothetical protein
MVRHQSTQQGGRTERASLAVTRAEKQAIKAVAAARETDESNLLRCTLLSDILAEYDRIRAVVGGEAA